MNTRRCRAWAAAVVCLATALIAAAPAVPFGQTAAPDPTPEILAVMQASQDAWNTGDIPGFMDAYLRGDAMRFASGGDVTYGWQAALDRYLARYSDRAVMGTLTFSDLDVTLLGEDAALVFGRWELQRAEDRPHGLTSLVFRRVGDSWRIVHDHTSSADD